jgi:hypothetical protein
MSKVRKICRRKLWVGGTLTYHSFHTAATWTFRRRTNVALRPAQRAAGRGLRSQKGAFYASLKIIGKLAEALWVEPAELLKR